jgi:hypothetical protein
MAGFKGARQPTLNVADEQAAKIDLAGQAYLRA